MNGLDHGGAVRGGRFLPALLAGFLGACAAAGGSLEDVEDAGEALEDAARDADVEDGFVVVADASADADASESIEDSGESEGGEPDADAAQPADGGSMDAAADAMPDAEPDDATVDAVPDEATVDAEPEDAAADAMSDAGPGDATTGIPDGSEPSEDAGPADDASPEDAGMIADAEPEPDSRCVPGVYKGTFEGELRFRVFLVSLNLFDIAGEIEITVEAAEDAGDNLQIRNGRIEGADVDGNPVVADVSGTLNCDTLELEDGRLTNGLYVREAFDMEVAFEGTVEAIYEPGDTPRVVGTWETEAGRESGDGTFEATLERPSP